MGGNSPSILHVNDERQTHRLVSPRNGCRSGRAWVVPWRRIFGCVVVAGTAAASSGARERRWEVEKKREREMARGETEREKWERFHCPGFFPGCQPTFLAFACSTSIHISHILWPSGFFFFSLSCLTELQTEDILPVDVRRKVSVTQE